MLSPTPHISYILAIYAQLWIFEVNILALQYAYIMTNDIIRFIYEDIDQYRLDTINARPSLYLQK